MQDYGTVLETVELDVYLADYGIHTKSLMVATIYQLPSPRLVLTRETFMPNADDVTVIYTQILGATFEDWKESLADGDSMIWNPVPRPTSGHKKN